jgi:hypothetical protein
MSIIVDSSTSSVANKFRKKLLIGISLPLISIFVMGMLFIVLFASVLNSDGSEGGYIPSDLVYQEVPDNFIPIYQAAAEAYNIPWTLLAAVHKVETNFSQMDPMVSPAGALGHFQFQPCTWLGWKYQGCKGFGNLPSTVDITNLSLIATYGGYGVDGNDDGKADPFTIDDATFTAAKYLSENGASDGRIKDALFSYNHADWYVEKVYNIFQSYNKGNIIVGNGEFALPLTNINITSYFGTRTDPFTGTISSHDGIDFAGNIGDPIFAVGDGTIFFASEASGYGNFVMIDHGEGIVTCYGHLNEIYVNVGDKVSVGDVIGEVGNTGRSTGPHLHFEVRVDGFKIDPAPYLGLDLGGSLDG